MQRVLVLRSFNPQRDIGANGFLSNFRGNASNIFEATVRKFSHHSQDDGHTKAYRKSNILVFADHPKRKDISLSWVLTFGKTNIL